MTQLAIVSTVVGALVVAGRIPGLVAPDAFRRVAVQFPRSLWAGRILMGIAAAIAWVIVYNAATDEWAKFRPVIMVGVPLAYWLVIQFGNTFLAVRGAAALILMLARVMVGAADQSELSSRLVVTTLAYVWAVAGIWMAIAPHHVRDLTQWAMASNLRCRWLCGVGVLVGLALVLLGLFVY